MSKKQQPAINYCKTLMFTRPLFSKFCKLNETAKSKFVNIDTIPTVIGFSRLFKLCGLNSPKQKAPK